MTGLETCPKSARDVVLATNVQVLRTQCFQMFPKDHQPALLRSTVGTPPPLRSRDP